MCLFVFLEKLRASSVGHHVLQLLERGGACEHLKHWSECVTARTAACAHERSEEPAELQEHTRVSTRKQKRAEQRSRLERGGERESSKKDC